MPSTIRSLLQTKLHKLGSIDPSYLSKDPPPGTRIVKSFCSVSKQSLKMDPFSFKENQPKLVKNKWIAGPWVDIPSFCRSRYALQFEECLSMGRLHFSFEFYTDSSGNSYGRLIEPHELPDWFARLEEFYKKVEKASMFKRVSTAVPKGQVVYDMRDLSMALGNTIPRVRYEATRKVLDQITNVVVVSAKAAYADNFNLTYTMLCLQCMAYIYSNLDIPIDPSMVMQIVHDSNLIMEGYSPLSPYIYSNEYCNARNCSEV